MRIIGFTSYPSLKFTGYLGLEKSKEKPKKAKRNKGAGLSRDHYPLTDYESTFST